MKPIAELQVARFAPAKLPCNGVKPDFGRKSAASALGPPSARLAAYSRAMSGAAPPSQARA